MPVNVASLRTLLGAWMKDTVQLWEDGPPIDDEETGHQIPGPPIVHYDGPGLVYPQSQAERDVVVAGSTLQITRYNVMLPTNVDTTLDDSTESMHVKVITSDLEPELQSVDFVIVDIPLDPFSVATTAVAERVT